MSKRIRAPFCIVVGVQYIRVSYKFQVFFNKFGRYSTKTISLLKHYLLIISVTEHHRLFFQIFEQVSPTKHYFFKH